MTMKAGGMEIRRCTKRFVMSSFAGPESAQKHGPVVLMNLIIKGQEGKRIELVFFRDAR